MTPTKLLIGQILIVFAIVIAGVWASTQWAAAMLAYQPELGLPWFVLRHWPVYYPWALFDWWYHFDAYAPHVFAKAGMLAGTSGFLGFLTAVFGSLWRARQSNKVTTYGSARWASRRDIRRAGLFGDHGFMLGTMGEQYLRHDGPEHVMAFAPTRSGKGVGLVVPTLLTWTGSTVVHDIKGENWTLTAGWRANSRTACSSTRPIWLQPITIRCWRSGAASTRSATSRTSPTSSSIPKARWNAATIGRKTSHSLLVGAILHILYAEEEKTLARVAFLSDPQRSFRRHAARMMTTNHLGDESTRRSTRRRLGSARNAQQKPQ
jgi:type IV secretion system protein VirD4